MATTSFDKKFVVNDPKAVQRFKSQLGHASKVKVVERDVKSDSAKGLLKLAKKLKS